MKRLILPFLAAGLLLGQTPAPEAKDPLGRNNPQDAVFHFLEACHSRDYAKAVHYLDLRHMAPKQRATAGPELARQLEELLDGTPFSIETLSRDPAGDQSGGGVVTINTFHVDKKALDLQLERVELKPGFKVWLVSSQSLALIPEAHKSLSESSFEKKLPQQLVAFEILDTPVWRWIALGLGALAIWLLATLVSRGLVFCVRPLFDAASFRGPSRLLLATAAFLLPLQWAPPAVLPRLYIDRGLGLIFLLALAWTITVVVDSIAERWLARLDPRVQAVTYSILPLGRQLLKLAIYLAAILVTLSAWGYNTSAVLAGIGVGGLAIALAAQKTIENFFGGVSVIGDRPVLVGDTCRFGDHTGTVIHIGLRSTRIRTPERTVISVPNGQFSSMALENISGRDKVWFHPTLNLRRDTTSDQMSQLLASLKELLVNAPKVEVGPIPVRFIGVGQYSLDVEVFAYVQTSDNDEFLALQQDLLLKMLRAVEQAGTALAVPLQETFQPPAATA
jgi:MscS family membrane protein